MKLTIFLSLLCWLASPVVRGHDHQEEKKTDSHEKHDGHDHDSGEKEEDHKDDKEHDHDADEHGHDEEKHGHEEEEASGSVGPGKAVEEAHEETGIRLSTKALKRLGIKTMSPPENPSAYPSSALVRYQEEIGIYRHRQGWFKLVSLDSASFEAGDEIVVSGAALLRAAELDAFSGEGAGHGH